MQLRGSKLIGQAQAGRSVGTVIAAEEATPVCTEQNGHHILLNCVRLTSDAGVRSELCILVAAIFGLYG